jgi:hypothetical protein
MERHFVMARARLCAQTGFVTSAAVLLLAGSTLAQVPATPSPASTTASADANGDPTVQQTPEEPTVPPALSSMRIAGYADVGVGRPLQEKLPPGGLQNSKYSFQIADLELFITSKPAEHWSFLSDVLFTSDFSNEFFVEVDRLLVDYTANKHFSVGFGKFNSAIGYYPDEFHRAKFYQTATGRPLMFTDEDNGGVLPVHQVGVTAQGEIPSGSLGLHYVGEISNGRAFNRNSAEVQNFAATNNFKAVNGGLSIRPDGAPALDAGFTLYRDTVETDALAKIRETITAVHAVWVTPNFEFLNEVAILKHAAEAGGAKATTKSFYTQLSPRFGHTRPYVRYEYQNVPSTDPLFGLGDVAPAFGIRKAISGGVHFDLGVFAVIKVQYDRAQQYGVWANGGHAQLAVAF